MLRSVTDAPMPRPVAGQSITVTATVTPQSGPIASVTLTYVVNYSAETSISMIAAASKSTA